MPNQCRDLFKRAEAVVCYGHLLLAVCLQEVVGRVDIGVAIGQGRFDVLKLVLDVSKMAGLFRACLDEVRQRGGGFWQSVLVERAHCGWKKQVLGADLGRAE